MILIPNKNIADYNDKATPDRWQAWTAILRQYGQEVPEGWLVSVEHYNAVSAARHSGVYDAVRYPPPAIPATPARSPASQGAKSPATLVDRRTGGRGCHGCGGQSAVNATGSPEAINAVLTE